MNQRYAMVLMFAGAALSGCDGDVSTVGQVGRELPPAQVEGRQNLGIGEMCLPQREWDPDFEGAGVNDTDVLDRHAACASGICLVHHFSGRTMCPYGQAAPSDGTSAGEPICALPDGRARVNVAVPPQLVERRAEDTVYCSCRCAGPEGTGPFCTCPDGFECADVVPELGIPADAGAPIAGSYCIKQGTAYDPNAPVTACDRRLQNCGPG